MFTKPSLGDLVDGVTANAERNLLPSLGASPEGQQLLDALMALDRVAVEWSTAAVRLAEDNHDIGTTLARIGRPVDDVQTNHDGSATVDVLAADNRRLKAGVIGAIEALDLPSSLDDPPAVQRADREVRELLARMLQREEVAHPPTAPRQNPLSKAVAGLPRPPVRR